MKNIILIIISSFVAFVFSYLMVSFTVADIDFRNWTQNQRLVVSVFSFVLFFMVSAAAIIDDETEEEQD